MLMFLAIDAGGTSTRAVLVDSAGRCLGYGRAGGGNPTSAGIANAVAAVGEAAEQAVDQGHLSAETASSRRPWRSSRWPGRTPRVRGAGVGPPCRTGFRAGLREPDLLGIFHSGTHNRWVRHGRRHGNAAVRVVGGRLDRTVGGRGWLLGDAGGGFWIGHRVARAVVAALDGQGPPTALTERLLTAVGITAPLDSPAARAQVVRQLVSSCTPGGPCSCRPSPRWRSASPKIRGRGDSRLRVVGAGGVAGSRTRFRTWPVRSSWAAAY